MYGSTPFGSNTSPPTSSHVLEDHGRKSSARNGAFRVACCTRKGLRLRSCALRQIALVHGQVPHLRHTPATLIG